MNVPKETDEHNLLRQIFRMCDDKFIITVPVNQPLKTGQTIS